MQATGLYTILLVSFFFSATASAQVFDAGPSDPALFTSVINIPGEDAPNGVGGIATQQLNVADGGTVGIGFEARQGGEVNVSGGILGADFNAFPFSEVNISGGSVGDRFRAATGSNVNLFGSEFALNGVLMDDLTEREAFTILDREVTLSGVFTDGSAFSFDLNSVFVIGSPEDTFDPLATLTVTLISEPLLGDANRDGVVDFIDIPMFLQILCCGSYQAESDINEDGIVDFRDINPFVELLSS